jgi:hypothetical protein
MVDGCVIRYAKGQGKGTCSKDPGYHRISETAINDSILTNRSRQLCEHSIGRTRIDALLKSESVISAVFDKMRSASIVFSIHARQEDMTYVRFEIESTSRHTQVALFCLDYRERIRLQSKSRSFDSF